MNTTLKRLIYFLAFVEGGAVMCVELCSAKILSPYFGTSIYVWASVLGITLSALMSGYYLGGYISSKNQKKETIFFVMLLAGFFVSLIPIIANAILPTAINFSILAGTVMALLGFLFIPLTLFGSVSPLVINLLTSDAKESGKSSGNVYAISTLGGIITTFMAGFYTLPNWGITATLYAYGMLVVITALILFVASKTFRPTAALMAVLTLFSYSFKKDFLELGVIHKSEGILGEIKVVDRNLYVAAEKKYKPYRELMVNNISQTIMDLKNPDKSYWDYADMLVYNVNSYTQGKNTLLLGLGGGTLYKQLKKNDLNIDVVEIDARIEAIAREYFFLGNDVNIVVDDARHYIRTTNTKYDVIIYDLYHSETPPIHIMTKEAFGEIESKLNENGILAINFYGFVNGKEGKAARSIYKTLLEQGYQVALMATPGEEEHRNLLFICSKKELKPKQTVVHQVIEEKTLDFNDAVLLIDDKPELEHLYLDAALAWRRNYNEMNAKYFINLEKNK